MPIIKMVKGNLVSAFLDPNNLTITDIAHGCNCFTEMGAGIAKEINARILGVYEADRLYDDYFYRKFQKLGTYSFFESPNLAKVKLGRRTGTVFNLYTQLRKRRHKKEVVCDYDAIQECFRILNRDYPDMILGIPMIGCGKATGDWNIVRNIIQQTTTQLKVVVYYL